MGIQKTELKRQSLHIIIGLAVIFLLYKEILTATHLFIILILSGILSLLSLRFRIPIIYWFLRNFERPKQPRRFPGKGFIFFLIGVLLVIKLFERDVALAAIMILTLGDSISHIIGKNFGRVRHPLNGSKSVEGTIVGVFTGFIGVLILTLLIKNFSVGLLAAFLGSLVAMSIEALELKLGGGEVDDNIIVPLVSGTVIYLIQTNFAIFV